MGYFNRDNSSSGRGNYGNRSFGGGNSDREMFKATCADCGNACEIPFKPSTGRPVYCRDCFKKHSPDEGRGRDTDRDRNRGQANRSTEPRPFNNPSSPQLNDINAKLDRILELLSTTPKVEKKEKKPETVMPIEIATEATPVEDVAPVEEVKTVNKPKARKKAVKSE